MQIKEELKNLIPPLTNDEFNTLEKSILEEGIREPIIVWNGYIVDGHTRYKIAQKHNLEFKTVEKEFDDMESVKLWMIDNQKGRRNLTDGWKYELAQVKKAILTEKGREKQKETLMRGNEAPDLSIVDKTEHNTRKEIAQDLGWSTGKTAQADYVWNHAKDQIKDKVKSGDISINQAYKEVKKEVIATETKKKRAELAEKGAMVQKDERWNVYCGDMRTWQSEKQYDFIVTDPPYPKEYLPLWGVLAMRANEWLKEGGLLIAMSGQSYLDEIYKLLSEHLTYYWTASYLTPGQPTPLRQVNVNTTWKPLLIYRKGLYKGKIFGDVFKSDGNDKENHKWGQSESGMFDIISKMCLPGQSILDPFCGAGTTGVAALKHGCYFDGLEIELENVNISKARLQSLNGG